MATKRRKQRIERRIIRAFDKGKDDKSLVFTKRLENIATREGNRAIGNTRIQRGLNKVVDPLRNVAGLPARSLAANVSQAFPKANIKTDSAGKIIPTGTIMSPEQKLIEDRNKIVYGPTGKPSSGINSQNMDLLESDLSPATVSYSSGSKPKVVNDSAPTQSDFTQEDQIPIESLVSRSSAPVSTASRMSASPSASSSSVFGGNAPASTGGIQLGPDGQPVLGEDFSYTLTPEQRAEEEARKREQEYYKKEARQKIDREEIMRNALRQFQGEIDAVNAVFADKIAQAKLEGEDRLGSDRAANFNAGAVNSTFGEASKQRVLEFNRSKESAIQNEKLNLISQINSAARALGDKFYAEKKAAKEAGLESYMASLLSSKEAKTSIAREVAKNMITANIAPENMTEKQLKTIAKSAGVSVELIKNSFTTVKTEIEEAQAEADRKARTEGAFTLGKTRYDQFGNVIATEGSTFEDGSISPEAQNIVNLMNTQGGTVDDYIKGISGEAQALRNEVYKALSEQGGVTEKSTKLFQEAKTIIDDMIEKEDWKRFGYSAKLGGKLSVKYGDMEARADTINAILARDNLGLLKGAMSDKDLAFIQAMSAGVPKGVISEKYAKERMESIQKKLAEKVAQYTPGGAQTKTIEDYRLEFPEATDEELQALMEEEQGSLEG